jgi:hypothetical protein
MTRFLAAVEVDQRQRFILEADKLQEMLGASRIIGESMHAAEQAVKRHPEVRLAWRVSGVQWLLADDLGALGKCLWEIRQGLLEDLSLSASFAIVEWEDGTPFKAATGALELRMREKKDAKCGEDGSPASPWFAQCRLQPHKPANVWVPDKKAAIDERRRLVSAEADLRRKKAKAYRAEWKAKFSFSGFYEDPEDFEDFVESDADSYIALVKADVDGMGRLLAQLDWDKLANSLGVDAPAAALSFSGAVDRCVRESLAESVNSITETAKKVEQPFPILPIVVAGDDLWVLARKSKAYAFALEMGTQFACKARDDGTLKAALEVSGLAGKDLTFSFGILFAKQGYPFDAQLDLAEELVHSAKKLRRSQTEGCLDFQWLESSGRETVEEARRQGYEYREAGAGAPTYRLYTRPWTLSDARSMREAAEALGKAGIARRKLHQLGDILRMGGDLSLLAIHQWWSRLERSEQSELVKALAMMPEPWKVASAQLAGVEGKLPLGPWRKNGDAHECALLELVELAEILGPAPKAQGAAA